MDISELRRQTLRAEVARLGGFASVVKAYGLTQSQGSYLSQLTAADSTASFGEKSAKNWEQRLRLPSGILVSPGQQGTPVAALDEGEPLGDEYIQIRESEVRFAAGNGRTPLFDEVTASVPRTYRRDWFIKEGINPEHARCFKVHGESMESFLFDGDSVLVNLAEKEIVNGKVYALRYGEELRIKRVYKKLDGGLILHSDNPNYRPIDEDISASSAAESISIIGRVRDKSGTGGL